MITLKNNKESPAYDVEYQKNLIQHLCDNTHKMVLIVITIIT